MNLYLRLLLTLLKARLSGPLSPYDTSRVSFRVWPHDCDVNLHMNNGRYATLMDLGRVDLMARAGLLAIVRRHRMFPVVTAQHLTYRRPLDPFVGFDLETEVLGWDDRAIMIEQRFVRRGAIHARGYVQALFLDADGRVPTSRLLDLFGLDDARPIPDDVAALFPASARIPG